MFGVVGEDTCEETVSDSPAEIRLMHGSEKCVRGIRCMVFGVVGEDACEETFSDSPAELTLMQGIEKCVRGIRYTLHGVWCCWRGCL